MIFYADLVGLVSIVAMKVSAKVITADLAVSVKLHFAIDAQNSQSVIHVTKRVVESAHRPGLNVNHAIAINTILAKNALTNAKIVDIKHALIVLQHVLIVIKNYAVTAVVIALNVKNLIAANAPIKIATTKLVGGDGEAMIHMENLSTAKHIRKLMKKGKNSKNRRFFVPTALFLAPNAVKIYARTVSKHANVCKNILCV